MTGGDNHLETRILGLLRNKLQVNVESMDTDLLDTGLLDSLGLVELIVLLESDFGVRVAMDDLDPEHFQSVNRIATLVRRMSAGSGPKP